MTSARTVLWSSSNKKPNGVAEKKKKKKKPNWNDVWKK
jgi:hypothetical protein